MMIIKQRNRCGRISRFGSNEDEKLKRFGISTSNAQYIRSFCFMRWCQTLISLLLVVQNAREMLVLGSEELCTDSMDSSNEQLVFFSDEVEGEASIKLQAWSGEIYA